MVWNWRVTSRFHPGCSAPPPPSPPAVEPVLRGDLLAIKRFISTTLHDALGPDADLFMPKVEAATNLQALLSQAEKLREVLRGASSGKKAEQFWEKLNTMVTSG